MVYIFPLTAILNIVVYILNITLLVLFFTDIINFWICILALMLSFVLVIGVNKLAYHLYCKSLDRCDTDYDSFVREQEKFSYRARKNPKIQQIIDLNIIAGTIAHEKYDEARKRMAVVGNTIPPNDVLGRFQYLSFLLVIETNQKNFSNVDYYTNEMRTLLSLMHNRPGFNETYRRRYQLVIEDAVVSAEFFSRPPERLANEDRQITHNMLSVKQQLKSLSHEVKVFTNFYRVNLNYDSGIVYTILGETSKAEECFDEVLRNPYTYPMLDRVREYRRTGDINVLMQ